MCSCSCNLSNAQFDSDSDFHTAIIAIPIFYPTVLRDSNRIKIKYLRISVLCGSFFLSERVWLTLFFLSTGESWRVQGKIESWRVKVLLRNKMNRTWQRLGVLILLNFTTYLYIAYALKLLRLLYGLISTFPLILSQFALTHFDFQ